MILEDLIILNEKIEKLEAENEKLRKCVEFYAKPSGSYVRGLTTYTRYCDDATFYEDAGYKLKLQGKFARQTLKEL